MPAEPKIAAQGVAFDTKTLIVPAGRPFDLIFNNNDAGVPHNVEIDDVRQVARSSSTVTVVTGVTTATYTCRLFRPGTYYFLCKVHPNMNGTVTAARSPAARRSRVAHDSRVATQPGSRRATAGQHGGGSRRTAPTRASRRPDENAHLRRDRLSSPR